MRCPLQACRVFFIAAVIAGGGCTSVSSSRKADASGLPSGKVEHFADPSAEQLAKAHAHYGAAIIHEMNNEPELALKAYLQAALTDLDDEDLVLEVSRRYLQARQYGKALDLVSKAAERPNASGAIFARRGLLLSQLGRRDEAIVAFRRAIEISPGSLDGYQHLSLLLLQNKQTAEAFEVLDQASAQTNVPPEFLMALAELYWSYALQSPAHREHSRAKSSSLLRAAVEVGRLDSRSRFTLAEQLMRVGESELAAQQYLEVLKDLPNVPGLRERIHARLSEIYLRAEDHERAKVQLLALLRDDPANAIAHYFLGGIALEEQKPETAIEHFQRALTLNPDFEHAHYDLANAQLSSGNTSAALATLAAARTRFTQSFVSEFLTAVALARQKSFPEALQRFTNAEIIARASDTNRLTRYFYFQFGATAERAGDYSQAARHFEKTLEISPDFHEAMNYLGYMWAEQGVQLDKAKDLIERALKAEPKNAAYLDSMGWVLFKQNQAEKALPYLLQAIENSEEPDATLQDHLGDVYEALGNSEFAIEAWKKSLDIEDSEAVRHKIEGKTEPKE